MIRLRQTIKVVKFLAIIVKENGRNKTNHCINYQKMDISIHQINLENI